MPREARKHSIYELYHIIYKGVDNQDIFYEEKDKIFFLNKLLESKLEFNFKIYAYCLMSNHVHLVIKINHEILAKAMKSLSVKYVSYFNKKYCRSGPLFQNRFKSKSIENQKYFLDVCRYVEQNPEKAGICKIQEYKWNSYNEYIGHSKLIDREDLLYYFNNNIEDYKYFTTRGKSDNKEDFIEYELKKKMTDDELSKLIVKEFNLANINEFSELPIEELEKSIEFFKDLQYTSIRQISRVIRINLYQLKKYWK